MVNNLQYQLITDDILPRTAGIAAARWLKLRGLPLTPLQIAQYLEIHDVTLSPHYLPILMKLNGAHVFEFSLFGIPPSMVNNPPLLNRSAAMPYDVATANHNWKGEYAIPIDWFHFGGGPLSFDENIGYFLDSSGKVFAARKNGESLNSWVSFSQFLHDELGRCEALYPAYEEFMAKAIRKSNTPWWKKIFKA